MPTRKDAISPQNYAVRFTFDTKGLPPDSGTNQPAVVDDVVEFVPAGHPYFAIQQGERVEFQAGASADHGTVAFDVTDRHWSEEDLAPAALG